MDLKKEIELLGRKIELLKQIEGVENEILRLKLCQPTIRRYPSITTTDSIPYHLKGEKNV